MDGRDRRLRIVHVVRQFRPGIGGLENFVEQLAQFQGRAGHDVTVCTLNRIFDAALPQALLAQEKQGPVEVRRIPFVGSRRYPLAPAVLRHLHGSEVVHVHGVDFFCDFLAATRWFHRKPLILTTHGGFFHTGFARNLKRIYLNTVTRATLTGYAAVATCSASDTRQFEAIKRNGIVEIPNAVDVDKFAGLAGRDRNQVLYFGRLAPNKGLHDLIEWFRGFRALDARWTLAIAGKPMGVSCAELQAHIDAANLGDAATVYVSPTDAELAGLIARSSVYACASSYEGFGLAAVEAASAGLFPVLNRIPPFRETIARLRFGQLVDFSVRDTYSHSYQRLREGLRSFRQEWTSADVREAVASYGWEHAAAKYEDLYLSAIGHASRKIGDIRVGVHSEDDAVELVTRAAAAGEPRLVTFANAHTVNLAARDATLRKAIGRATVFNDGIGADVASWLLYGAKFPHNLNGTDLLPALLARLDESTPVFLLGTTDSNVRAAATAIAERHPRVRIAGWRSGYFGPEDEEGIGETIRQSGARIVLVGMGQPRQELWAERHFEKLGVVAICVGAFLDFTAGAVPRAPAAWRKLRIEWAFRLLQEPRRLAGRYLVGNLAFLARLAGQAISGHRV